MRTITVTQNIFKYSELEQNAQDKVKNNLIDSCQWWECTVEDFKEIGKILGIEIDSVYFRGFWSQGDGACFVGSYAYSAQCHKKIREYAPTDKELHAIADRLLELQKQVFYHLSCTVKHVGHYYHEGCTSFNWYSNRDGEWLNDLELHNSNELQEVLRDYMRWMYSRLEEEYEFQISDNHMEDVCDINGWEFYSDGEIYSGNL